MFLELFIEYVWMKSNIVVMCVLKKMGLNESLFGEVKIQKEQRI